MEIIFIPTMLQDMQKRKNIAIIVAAGTGSRFGDGRPKQFLKLKGREILDYSVTSFSSHPLIHEVIIVTSNTHMDHVAQKYPNCTVALGGASRQDSVFNGLKACPKEAVHVLVHDAARPLVPSTLIDSCLQALEQYDGVAPAIKPVDSMVTLTEKTFEALSREDLRIVQTPQCFRAEVLKEAHASDIVDTDEMGLVKQAIPNAKLTLIDGAPETMKITRSSDLILIESFLKNN